MARLNARTSPNSPTEEAVFPMSFRILMASLCLAAVAFAPLPADAAKSPVKRDFSKEFDELTPSEQIAIRAAAKAAYKAKKLKILNVCADPGNMPLSNIKEEGFQNKLATLLGEAMGARVTYSWRPFLERGLTRQTFDQDMCDVMFDMPANYGALLDYVSRLQDPLMSSHIATIQRPRTDRPRRPQAQGPEDRRVPDLGHSRGARQARHRLKCRAAGAEPRRRSRSRASAVVARAKDVER